MAQCIAGIFAMFISCHAVGRKLTLTCWWIDFYASAFRPQSLCIFRLSVRPLSLSLSLCPCPSVCMSVHQSGHPSILSVHLSVRLCPSVHPSVFPSIHPSVCLPIRVSARPSAHLSTRPSVHLSIHLSVNLSIRSSVCIKNILFCIIGFIFGLDDFLIYTLWFLCHKECFSDIMDECKTDIPRGDTTVLHWTVEISLTYSISLVLYI